MAGLAGLGRAGHSRSGAGDWLSAAVQGGVTLPGSDQLVVSDLGADHAGLRRAAPAYALRSCVAALQQVHVSLGMGEWPRAADAATVRFLPGFKCGGGPVVGCDYGPKAGPGELGVVQAGRACAVGGWAGPSICPYPSIPCHSILHSPARAAAFAAWARCSGTHALGRT